MKLFFNIRKFISTVISAIACLIVIILVSGFIGDVFGGRGYDAEIAVPDGATGGEIISILEENGVIKYPFIFKVYARLTKSDSAYKSGDFIVNTGASYAEILKVMTSASNSEKNIARVTIPEGFEVYRMAEAFEKAGVVTAEEFLKAADSTDYDFDFIKGIRNIDKRMYALEGYLFPDTYVFHKNTPARVVVETMLKGFENVISKYSVEDIDSTIILASIIEREALGDSDRNMVSSVFHNRLASNGHHLLQSCATVQYILGERKDVLSEADTKIDSPYNTYMNPGLPIGPIACPGEASIAAALNPADTDYLYFVRTKKGEHAFAKTYQEHLANSRK